MIHLKFNRTLTDSPGGVFFRSLIFGLLVAFVPSVVWCGDVTPEMARGVADGQIRHHAAIFGSWNGSVSPGIIDHETIVEDGMTVAYHFRVNPSGYVIVAADDDLSPVPFYSTRSSFDTGRADNPNAIESWMAFRLGAKAAVVRNFRKRANTSALTSGLAHPPGRIRDAWAYFDRLSGNTEDNGSVRSLSKNAAGDSDTIVRGAVVAPLLTTIWGQGSPYNFQTPDDGCADGHTLTGCVATAWAQLLNYWQWPPEGVTVEVPVGYEGYNWVGETVTEVQAVDFSNTEAHDWRNMSDDLNAPGTTQSEIDAVSRLMFFTGVAAEMDFGCPESATGSGSAVWADEALDVFFKFKPLSVSANRRYLADYSAGAWFSMIKTELDADPPRPVIFSMGSPNGWHEVVVDGYQEGETDRVHINFGWEFNYDGWYDVTDDDSFNTGDIDWDVVSEQVMVIGIEPDNNPPVVLAGEDIRADEETAVALSVARASDPEGVGISGYLWTQISGPAATVTNATSATPTIITPAVDEIAQLVFQVRVTDVNRAFGTDTCTVTVNNTDGSVAAPAPSSSGSGGGGGGGCFLDSLFQ